MEKTEGFGPQLSPQNQCLIKMAVCLKFKPLFVRFHQKMPVTGEGDFEGKSSADERELY